MTDVAGRGVIRSPNIWDDPDVYEVENRAVDRAGVIEAAMERLHPLAGADLLDVGCGTGFHLPRFAALGARVVGVEPHQPLVERARERLESSFAVSPTSSVAVLRASAEALPIADDTVDVVHARWAYFFGAGSEPGLRELARVLLPGGVACVIDNDATRSTFGEWFRRAYPDYDPIAVERFWTRQGWERTELDIRWEFDTRADFDAVIGIEFPPATADFIRATHRGTGVDYAVVLRHRTF